MKHRAHSLPALLLILLGLPSTCSATEVAALDALLERLARPVPSEIDFVERKSSKLLDQPLILRGRLAHPDADTLIREVRSPYHELARIHEGRVELQRDGEPSKQFSLRRAPELAVLLDSFRAVLAGDRRLLERHFTFELQQRDEAFALRLSPIERRLRKRVDGLELFGSGKDLHCLRVLGAQTSSMLLGAAASAITPQFETHCSLRFATP